MKTATTALIGIILLTAPAFARDHHDDSDSLRNLGLGNLGLGGLGLSGLGLGGRGNDLGGPGLGFNFFNVDRILGRVQLRFEDRLDTLQNQYDSGVENTTDFFNSSRYDRILDRTELLSDTYGLFLSGVQRSIDRIPDIVAFVNEDITFYNDLLSDYQTDTSLSAKRLARIERTINGITDRLDTAVDRLTQTQTTLQTNLPTYQAFQTDISTFLTDITAAGGGTTPAATTTTTGAAAGIMSLVNAAITPADTVTVSAAGSATLSAASSPVPEPSIAVLAMIAGALLTIGRSSRRAA